MRRFIFSFTPMRALVALLTGLSISLPLAASSQTTVNAATLPPVISQTHAAFSSGAEIKTVTLTGSVAWTVGSTNDTGTFTLTVSKDGSSSMSLLMNARGAYQETYGPAGNGRTCEWKGADGVAHSADSSSCALPTAWFLPSLALQSTSSNIAVSDKGLGQLGSVSLYLLELRPALASPLAVLGMPASYGVQTIGLDPNTMLPASLKHQLFPGPNPLSPVAVEVDYSQYAKENGVQIPHSIVRRLNGAVDLAFTVATVTVGPSSVPQ